MCVGVGVGVGVGVVCVGVCGCARTCCETQGLPHKSKCGWPLNCKAAVAGVISIRSKLHRWVPEAHARAQAGVGGRGWEFGGRMGARVRVVAFQPQNTHILIQVR